VVTVRLQKGDSADRLSIPSFPSNISRLAHRGVQVPRRYIGAFRTKPSRGSRLLLLRFQAAPVGSQCHAAASVSSVQHDRRSSARSVSKEKPSQGNRRPLQSPTVPHLGSSRPLFTSTLPQYTTSLWPEQKPVSIACSTPPTTTT
jgi:hypothetical protein